MNAVDEGVGRDEEENAVEIRITWTESLLQSFTGMIFRSWQDADAALAEMARGAPVDEYDHTGYTVTWLDGGTFRGTIALTRADAHHPALLSEHLRRTLGFLAGGAKPHHLPDDVYQQYLGEIREHRPEHTRLAERLSAAKRLPSATLSD